MAFVRSARALRAAPLAAAALLVLAFAGTAGIGAPAAPAPANRENPIAVSLEQSATAYPVTESFGYTAHIRLGEPSSYLQVRLQVRRPDGKLVYQRTQIDNSVPAGDYQYAFGRPIPGLDLKPGVYPSELSIRADIGGSTVTTSVATNLLVYDGRKAPVPVVLIARLHAQPLSDPQGRLAIDPAVATAQRDDVDRITTLVIGDPVARVTLVVPPLTLAEWKRLSGGYNLADGSAVGPDDPTARSYADTLSRLADAIDTGRLELVSLGYSDPDLTALADEALAPDATPQYQAGVSAIFASLETTPSTGTVPAGDCVPAATLPSLSENGIGYVVSSAACARLGTRQASTGAYPVGGSRLTALITDDPSSLALSSADTSAAISRTFNRSVSGAKPVQPFAIRVDLGEGRANASDTVVAAVDTLESLPWVTLVNGRDAIAPPGARIVTLSEGKTKSNAPADYWRTVRSARQYAEAILAALGTGDATAVSAQADSLIAESSAWAEPLGRWKYAERGLAFADQARSTSRAILDNVKIKAIPVTLAGAKGEVPVTVTNGTQRTLSVVLRTHTSGGIRVVGPDNIPTVLRPQETFVQVPVDLQSALSGTLRVDVVAGDLVIAHSTVEVKASYLDRLAIVGGVVVVLGIMLAFIIRRVRRAEIDNDVPAGEADATEHDPSYTGSTDEIETGE